jgi:hypothetical protein
VVDIRIDHLCLLEIQLMCWNACLQSHAGFHQVFTYYAVVEDWLDQDGFDVASSLPVVIKFVGDKEENLLWIVSAKRTLAASRFRSLKPPVLHERIAGLAGSLVP